MKSLIFQGFSSFSSFPFLVHMSPPDKNMAIDGFELNVSTILYPKEKKGAVFFIYFRSNVHLWAKLCDKDNEAP